ncbi:MAG: GvpL/GvpF family gas vesicle protein [Desulfobaccales bacterium]|nr:GvpL/GvpF family gas vesicle protein [Desulfobaccales bacterium]
MSEGLYLFCLARLSRLPTLPLEGKGLDGQSPLEVAGFQDLAAVWSPVPLEDFCGPEAEERLRDLTWIGPRVIRHQEVVAGVMRRSPVLPTRFGTIFSSWANLEKVLKRHHDAIAGFLERITGSEEWAVKGMLDRCGAKEKLFSLTQAREAERLEALSPGKRYFQEQRLRAACDQELQQWLQEICRKLWTDLRDYAADVRERRLLSREATGSDNDMVLNWAFLVPEETVPGFQARIKEANRGYGEHGLVLECTGPWPPYSFCPALDLESEA